MIINNILEKFKLGNPIVNFWLSIPNSFTAEAIGKMNAENNFQNRPKLHFQLYLLCFYHEYLKIFHYSPSKVEKYISNRFLSGHHSWDVWWIYSRKPCNNTRPVCPGFLEMLSKKSKILSNSWCFRYGEPIDVYAGRRNWYSKWYPKL